MFDASPKGANTMCSAQLCLEGHAACCFIQHVGGPFGHSYFALSFLGVAVWNELSAFTTVPQGLALCSGAHVYIAYTRNFNCLGRGLWVRPVFAGASNRADPALPHTDFPKKRDTAHVKPPRSSYFINFIDLYWSGGITANMLVQGDTCSPELCI